MRPKHVAINGGDRIAVNLHGTSVHRHMVPLGHEQQPVTRCYAPRCGRHARHLQ